MFKLLLSLALLATVNAQSYGKISVYGIGGAPATLTGSSSTSYQAQMCFVNTANQCTGIGGILGPMITVTTTSGGFTGTASVSLDAFVDFSQAGISGLVDIDGSSGVGSVSIGGATAGASFTLGITGGITTSNIASVTISTPSLSAQASVLASLTSKGYVPGLVYWDASASTWVNLKATFASQQISATIPGSWFTASTLAQLTFAVTIVAPNVTVTYAAAKPRECYANVNNTAIFWAGAAGAQASAPFTSIKFNARSDFTLQVAHSSTDPTGSSASAKAAVGVAANIFLDVTATGSGAYNAGLKYYYTAQEMASASISASAQASLRFAWWDSANSQWVLGSGTAGVDFGVDTSAMVVWQNTNHFSTWAIYATQGSAAAIGASALMIVSLIMATLLLQ